MLPMLVAGLALLAGGLMLMHWFVAADPRTLALAARTAGIAILAVIAGYLALSGRIGWILGLMPFLLPLALRRAGRGGLFSGRAGPRTSRVRTRFFDMRLDHESGDLDGDVVEGTHAGRQLSQMSEVELLELHRSVRQVDRKSSLLLEAYLDRRYPDWRARAEEESGTANAQSNGSDAADAMSGGAMTREDAYRILGLSPGAGGDEIKAAYHRLIASVHPDRGGSSFLAAQVNRARDVLLGDKPTR